MARKGTTVFISSLIFIYFFNFLNRLAAFEQQQTGDARLLLFKSAYLGATKRLVAGIDRIGYLLKEVEFGLCLVGGSCRQQ